MIFVQLLEGKPPKESSGASPVELGWNGGGRRDGQRRWSGGGMERKGRASLDGSTRACRKMMNRQNPSKRLK